MTGEFFRQVPIASHVRVPDPRREKRIAADAFLPLHLNEPRILRRQDNPAAADLRQPPRDERHRPAGNLTEPKGMFLFHNPFPFLRSAFDDKGII